MSLKRMTEKELENAKVSMSVKQVTLVEHIQESYAEIDRLNELLREHAQDFVKWRELWESAKRIEERHGL